MWMKDREVLGGRGVGGGDWRRGDRDGETGSGDRIRVRERETDPLAKLLMVAYVCLPKLRSGLNLHLLRQSQVRV